MPYLISSLVHIACGVVVDTEHRNQAIWVTISLKWQNKLNTYFNPTAKFNNTSKSKTHPCNVASSGSNAAHCHPDTSGRLRNEGALLQGVIDPLNTVILHSKQEATRHLTKTKLLVLYIMYRNILTFPNIKWPWKRNIGYGKLPPCVWLLYSDCMSSYLESCGRLVPALKSVGEAWVNHFSDSRL